MQDAAALLERAYRMALLLQGRLATGADEAAFEPMTLAGELVTLLDDARVALLLRRETLSGAVLQAHGARSGRHAQPPDARCAYGMHGACPTCKEIHMNSTTTSTHSAVISSDHGTSS